MNLKKSLYNITSKSGITFLQKIFPEYFAVEPLSPSDRYIEYYFAIKNLPKPPAKVLDVGCTGSFFPLLLASFGYETYGIDVRNYPILNKLNLKNFTFVKGDIKKIPFPEGLFDYIICLDILKHLKRPDLVLHKLSPHLSSNGKLIVSLPNIARFNHRLKLLFGNFDYSDSGYGALSKGHLRFFTLKTASELIESTGYKIEKIKPTGFRFNN